MIANNSASILFHSTQHLYSTSGTEFFMAAFQEHFPDHNQSPHTHIGYVQNSILAYYSHYFSSICILRTVSELSVCTEFFFVKLTDR